MARPEDKIQYDICQYLQSRGIYFHSIPNEAAGNNPQRQMHLISLGLRSGVADLLMFFPLGKITYLEVKPPGKKQSPNQIKFEKRCKDHGLTYHVVRSVGDVENIIRGVK